MKKKDPNATAIEGGPQAVRREFDKAGTDPLSEFIFAGDTEIKPPAMLVKGLLPYEGIAFIGGQSGAGKTFLAIDLAHSLATGSAFFGRAVRDAIGVVIVASEGQAMIAARVEAVRRTKSPDIARLPIAWVPSAPPFKTDTNIKDFAVRLRAADKHLRSEFGLRLGAVIIDTVAATFELEDEDDNSEAARTIRKMRALGRATGALIIPVHHYGKAATTGLRGGSGWRAGADVVISVLADRNDITGEVKNREVALAKARDGIEGPIAPFQLRFVELGVDDDNDTFGACIIEPLLDQATRQRTTAAVSKELRTLKTFREAFGDVIDDRGADIRAHDDGPTVRGVRVQDVRAAFVKRYATGEGDERQRGNTTNKAFRRALEKLTAHYSTRVIGNEEWIWALNPGGKP